MLTLLRIGSLKSFARQKMAMAGLNTTSEPSRTVEDSIRGKLTELLQPATLKITNDSWKHKHHSAMRERDEENGETHFTVEVISELFRGKNTMQRHRMIYSALSEEFSSGLHALSLRTKTQEETIGGS